MSNLKTIIRNPSFPSWAKFAASDGDGQSFLYAQRPIISDEDSMWYVLRGSSLSVAVSKDLLPSVEWNKSLVEIAR